MKTLTLFLATLALSLTASAQLVTLTATTTTAAITSSTQRIPLTSATGIVVPNATAGTVGSLLYIVSPGSKGEAVRVQSLSGLNATVARGTTGTQATAHVSGAMVLIAAPNAFYTVDPQGACTTANTYATPYVNIVTGNEWLCSTVSLSWVAGFHNDSAQPVVTAAVASAASAITPSGPLFHVTGTAAVTGFNIPVGFIYGSFTIIPDAVFTWTAAGNIALAGSAVVNKALTFTWDATNGKWIPSYIA